MREGMEIRTRRWNDPRLEGDGFCLLITRYRPRGVRKEDETWDAWWPQLGPSKELHAAFYGKHGKPIGTAEYQKRYLAEIQSQQERIAELAARARRGETITLLCSSACLEEHRCHRTLLRELILEAVE
ncbi:MAG: DUF488 domain-containing protein [Myxococcaceae bacterium]